MYVERAKITKNTTVHTHMHKKEAWTDRHSLTSLAQLSHSVLVQSVWRKPYIASLEISMIVPWTVGLLGGWKSG